MHVYSFIFFTAAILCTVLRPSTVALSNAVVVLAEGAEEMETVITTDVLRRGGVNVIVAGLKGNDAVQCSRKVTIVPDTSLDEAVKSGPFGAVVLPGGAKGAQNLVESSTVRSLLENQVRGGRLIAAVGSAPIALLNHGINKGAKVTSHPSVKDKMVEGGYEYSEDRVVQDGKLITSRGPGTCFEFSLKIVEILQGKEKADYLVAPMLIKL